MKAYELLEQKGWCKGAPARDKKGFVTGYLSDDAAYYCILGALTKCYGIPMVFTLKEKIYAETKVMDITTWNDDPKRTKEEVINLLKSLDI